MEWNLMFFVNSVLFGVGLAMDAFSVSMANGLNEPRMKPGRMALIAGVFSVFQTAMPLLGWLCIHTIAQTFTAFQTFIPYIALVLLLYIGGKMLVEGIRCNGGGECKLGGVSFTALLVQGLATSIDALSVGFTIADYRAPMAVVESLIIGVVTFFICMAGLFIGKKFGDKLKNKASILGGVILIIIGVEIFLTGIL